MRINHNMMAMNTHRQLGISTNAGAKSMEKLSSGYKINRAGDDAAGLSISEKMRNQVRGLGRASANAQDGISLIQTAEGALDESHAILKRMRELTVQAGNEGTLEEDDMNAINDEYQELAKELDGIAERTEFNGKKLLDGSYKGQLQIGANQDQSMDLEISTITNKLIGEGAKKVGGATIESGKDATITLGSDDYSKIKLDTGATDTTITDKGDGVKEIVVKIDDADTLEDIKGKLAEHGITIDIELAGDETVEGVDIDKTTGLQLNGLEVTTSQTDAKGGTSAADLGVSNLEFEIDSEDQSAQVNSNLGKVDKAITTVSKLRSHLGANQNRLEHTISNLDNAAENIQASESRIRDVDMAKEMMEQTRQNILQQASTSMLAQANMAPQSVLQLLG